MRAETILSRLPASTIRLGLERIQAACKALGNPQGAYPSVLVAGTNGKGSTCAFLAASLAASGAKVGLYTSPHLISFRERIRIGGEMISEEELDSSMARLLEAWPSLAHPDHPDALTYFEAATALAFDAFARLGVEIAVLEVGLGGRLDATNVEGKDLRAAVVTKIALDHGEFLGSSLDGIAREKAGIARAGVPLILAPQHPAAAAALREEGTRVGARTVDTQVETRLETGAEGFTYHGLAWKLEGITLGLLGSHQIDNARGALATLEQLGIPKAAARRGLREARWPGRMQVVSERPLVVLDGAHNPEAAQALARDFSSIWPGRRPRLIFGALADKERRQMMEALFPLARAVHLCEPPSPRAVPVETLMEEGAHLAGEVFHHQSVEDALQTALRLEGEEGAVLVCGSLYLVGAALPHFVGVA